MGFFCTRRKRQARQAYLADLRTRPEVYAVRFTDIGVEVRISLDRPGPGLNRQIRINQSMQKARTIKDLNQLAVEFTK